MIVLGIAPGVRHLAYCVLSYKENGQPRVPDFGADLLKGIRMHDNEGLFDLHRKVGIHVKILEVIFERFPPMMIAVGPPAIPSEPELNVAAARFVLRHVVSGLAERGMPVRHVEWETKQDLARALDVDKWSTILDGRIENAKRFARRLKKPAVRVAAAAALAGGRLLRIENCK